MKFYLSLIAFIFVSLFISSGFAPTSRPLAQGDAAPDFTLASDSSMFSLSGSKGTPVLLTFWSVTDADSRRDCNLYSSALADFPVRHVAINLDQNSTLYKEVLVADALAGPYAFSPSAQQAAHIAHSYALDGGFGSVLISAEGRILAFNPDPQTLRNGKRFENFFNY